MSKIEAKVIADSNNKFGNRLTTFVVTFPRFILAELNTHRMFSRNSASSRAIPFDKMVKSVEDNPFIPMAWQKEHKGMQGTEYFTKSEDIIRNNAKWMDACRKAITSAKWLDAGFPEDESGIGVSKQLCNRLLEPFMWHTVIITASEYENFFALRCPKYQVGEGSTIFRSRKDFCKAIGLPYELDYLKFSVYNKGQAEIHMMALAEAMWDAYNESTPKELKDGEWHIPFGDSISNEELVPLIHTEELNKGTDLERAAKRLPVIIAAKVKIATARCAQISYTVVGEDGKESSWENLIKLHDRLLKSGHMSCFEHCAKAMNNIEFDQHICGKTNLEIEHTDGHGGLNVYVNLDESQSNGWSGNFRGFIQYRKTIPNEAIYNQ